MEKKGKLPNPFYKANIILISRGENYKLILLTNTDAKILNEMLAN